MKIDIDRLYPKDYKDVASVEEKVFNPEVAEDKEEIMPVLKYPGTRGFIMRNGVKPLGYAVAGPLGLFEGLEDGYPDDFEYGIKRESPEQSAKTLYFHAVAVDPEYSGEGFGGQLIKKVIDDAKSQGYEKIALSVYSKENVSLFKKYGAEIVHQEKGFYEDGKDLAYCILKL